MWLIRILWAHDMLWPWRCLVCHRLRLVRWHLMRTQYHDERSNYVRCCSGCIKEIDDYWDDMWSDYYRSVR